MICICNNQIKSIFPFWGLSKKSFLHKLHLYLTSHSLLTSWYKLWSSLVKFAFWLDTLGLVDGFTGSDKPFFFILSHFLIFLFFYVSCMPTYVFPYLRWISCNMTGLPLACSLETTLRNYSCLTTGDSIMVAYNNKKYYIDIVETKPSNAISIIETDCEVDFAPPLDYKEPEKPVASVPPSKATSQGACISLFFHEFIL